MTDLDTGFKNPTPEYPDTAQLAGYGGFAFLFLRTPRYANLTLDQVRSVLQPPLDLRFFHLHTIDGVPRAGITWAFLSPQAEQKILLSQRLEPVDWLSGKQVWIMDVIAPYGQGMGALLTRRFLQQLPIEAGTVRFARYSDAGHLKHVVEYKRHPDGQAEQTAQTIPDAGRWRTSRLSPQALAAETD